MPLHRVVLLIVLLSPLSVAAESAFTLVCTLHDDSSSHEWTMKVDPGTSTVDGRRAKIDKSSIAWEGKDRGYMFRHQINRRTGVMTSKLTDADGGPTTTFRGECLAGDKRTL